MYLVFSDVTCTFIVDAGSGDNQDIKSSESACSNANNKWKDFIKEAASVVADEAACVAKCTADDSCQYGVWVATGTKCYLGQFDAASPVTVTEPNAVTKIFYKNGKESKNNTLTPCTYVTYTISASFCC